MVAENREETALGSARGRFLDSLPRRAIELRGAVALLSQTPSAAGPREDMRRRLQSLYASALVFRDDVLAQAVHEGIERLDAVRHAGRGLEHTDLELLTRLVRRLPELHGDARGRAVTGPRASSGQDSAPDGELASAAPASELVGQAAASALPQSAGSAPTLTLHDGGADGSVRTRFAGDDSFGPERPLLQRVLQVLLVPASGDPAELLELLRCDSLRVDCAADAAEAITSVREDAPDLVLANERLARVGGLIAALRADPTTASIPIVLFEGAASAGAGPGDERAGEHEDGFVARPFGAAQLVRAIGRATGTLIEPLEPARVGALTLDELAERVGRELRSGLVDDAVRGRAAEIALGEGSDVLASVYGALAELRGAVARAGAGAVQFAARTHGGGPALVGAERVALEVPGARLHGRRVLLVGEDTALVLLLANLLRDQGATVHPFTDGREAREAARRERPDLVITGARVPNLDGFALCRALRRDPLLADLPVLLLPPREQLLARAKEGAATQLQREAAEQLLASAERLLRPQAELEARLRAAGELRGSLTGIGVISLLRSVRRARPDAVVSVRDSWNLFECELSGGRLAEVTRTASDGSFVRNERALPQLLGATAGRFSVGAADGPVKVGLEGTLDEVLVRGARELAAELDAVSGARLARVARVVFDEDAYALLVRETPPEVRAVIERLYAGEAPSKLLKEGVELDLLEPILLDMARRGALRGVVGSAGEDLVAEARAAHAKVLATELASPLSIVPAAPNPVISVLHAGAPAATPGEPGEARSHAAAELPVPRGPRASLPEVVEARAGARERTEEGRGRSDVAAREGARAGAREASVSEASELAAAAAEARRSRSTLAAWTVALFALVAVGIFMAREPEGGAMPEALGGGLPLAPAQAGRPEALPPRLQGGSLISAEDNGFAVYDGILDPAFAVAPGHALLVIEATPELAGTTIFLNDRELGAPPQRLALPEGVHELAIKRGDAISYRFFTVHPGRTWVLRN